MNDLRTAGEAIFGHAGHVASIDAAKRYYAEFKAQQEQRTPDERLKIAIIYSYAPRLGALCCSSPTSSTSTSTPP